MLKIWDRSDLISFREDKELKASDVQRLEELGGHIQTQRRKWAVITQDASHVDGIGESGHNSKHGHSGICMMERKGMTGLVSVTNVLFFSLHLASISVFDDWCSFPSSDTNSNHNIYNINYVLSSYFESDSGLSTLHAILYHLIR